MKNHNTESDKASSVPAENIALQLAITLIGMMITLAIVQSYFGPDTYTCEEKKEFLMRNPGMAYWLLPCETDNYAQ